MSSVVIGERPVSSMTDAELADWMGELSAANGYNALRGKTAALYVAIMRLMDENEPPMTARGVFYGLVSAGRIAKSEHGYKRACYHLLQMRRRGILPYDFVADNTRMMRKPHTYDSIHAFLEISRDTYRRALWQDQNAYVEIWCEKDALAGVLSDVTREWDVPLMVSRGFASETFLYEAAEQIKAQAKPAYVYYFGDHDPSGVAITESIRRRLAEFGATFTFERVAVEPWQIEAWGLPTRPTKRTDSRAKGWQGGSVELDAIPARHLRQLARDVIEQHVDRRALEQTKRTEELERETLEHVIGNLGLV